MPRPVAKRSTTSIGRLVTKPLLSEKVEKMAVNSIIALTRPIRSAMMPPSVPPRAMPRNPAEVTSAIWSMERLQSRRMTGAAVENVKISLTSKKSGIAKIQSNRRWNGEIGSRSIRTAIV